MPSPSIPSNVANILFLDGDCFVCQRSARLLDRLDRNRHLHFATLQGETAKILPTKWRQLTGTDGKPIGATVLIENYGQTNEKYWRSADAILRALTISSSLLKPIWICHYIPSPIKDWLYRFIAKNRHRVTWESPNCPLPPPSFRDRLLP